MSGSSVDSRVLGYGLGGGVVLALSSEHTLLDSRVGCDIRVVGVGSSGTNVRGVVVSVNLLSVGVVDGIGSVRVLAGLELESGQVFSGEEEEVDEEEDTSPQYVSTSWNHLSNSSNVSRDETSYTGSHFCGLTWSRLEHTHDYTLSTSMITRRQSPEPLLTCCVLYISLGQRGLDS